MTKIRCPHCGSPVRLRGQRWECTWCGDFGSLASLSPTQKAKLLQAVRTPERLASEHPRTAQAQDNLQPAPDYAALEDAVRSWDFSQYEWACRDLLLAAFPDAARRFSPVECAGMDTMDLLLAVAEADPDTAVAMMELLLNTAEGHLQQEDTARQLFQNAYVDTPQEDLIRACGQLGQPELQRKLLVLLDENPYPHDPVQLD